ncbi:MAG TPA: DUF805 domain-containing protein [Gammaproteobacteria bacterium]|nr:DUF805 domain-containing protein [Gammaproteobacteria bacterium]
MNAVNPYTSPQSAVADPADNAVGEVRIFSARARIGRVRYLAYTVGMYLLVSFASSLVSGVSMVALGPSIAPIVNMVVTIAVIGGFLVYSFLPTIQRLHDFDASGLLSLLTLVPFVNFILFLVLLFIPGTDGRNRFGPKPPPNSTGVTVVSILASLFFFIALLGIVAAIAIPAYQGYVHRAEQMQHQQTAPPSHPR